MSNIKRIHTLTKEEKKMFIIPNEQESKSIEKLKNLIKKELII